MSQLELFHKHVEKKIINNVEYGEVKLEDIMPNIAPNQYILYPTGGYHYFCNIKNAPEKYKKPIWPYLSSTTRNKTIIVSILPNVQFGGYPTATLKWKEGCHTSLTTPQVMHRIVALAYVPNPDPITHIHVAHKEDEKCNYIPEHLEWTTPSNNHKGKKPRRSSYEEFYDFFAAQKWVKE